MTNKSISVVPFESNPTESVREVLDSTWGRLIRRRKFLQGVGLGTAAAGTGTLFAEDGNRLSRGDVALLRLAAAIETIEADLWQQYNELGGAVDHNDQPNPGNPAYIAALKNLDGDMPQYISDNTDDEISHAAFLNAYLISKSEQPVNLDAFRTLSPTKATGANQNFKRLTNLQALNVDTSWYFRYRSTQN
ncbi:MAG TPA: twin-arginine translocation signal domain-containing protein, partial [Bryobacteraceae bacterium]|nr:twin-arginine translocation signal domain-containing protein [Bryobacteraceae bacterium]